MNGACSVVEEVIHGEGTGRSRRFAHERVGRRADMTWRLALHATSFTKHKHRVRHARHTSRALPNFDENTILLGEENTFEPSLQMLYPIDRQSKLPFHPIEPGIYHPASNLVSPCHSKVQQSHAIAIRPPLPSPAMFSAYIQLVPLPRSCPFSFFVILSYPFPPFLPCSYAIR